MDSCTVLAQWDAPAFIADASCDEPKNYLRQMHKKVARPMPSQTDCEWQPALLLKI